MMFAIVGATGVVGQELLSLLAERGVPASSVRALASSRSAGTEVAYGDARLFVEELTGNSFAGVDIALFSAGADTARQFAPAAAATGAAHAESVNVTLATAAAEAQVREALEAAPGVTIVDDRAANDFPTSLKASGGDDVLVGRIRPDESQGTDHGAWRAFDLFIAGDQLRKGAALNALQIADLVTSRGN